MMIKQELIETIQNSTISDEEVFRNLKQYIDSVENSSERFTPKILDEFDEIRQIMFELRPMVLEMLKKEIDEEHKDCCSGSE